MGGRSGKLRNPNPPRGEEFYIPTLPEEERAVLSHGSMKDVALKYDEYAKKLLDMGAMSGLSATQRHSLADMVAIGGWLDKAEDINTQHRRWQRIYNERSPRQLKKLRDKFDKAKTALTEVRDFAEKPPGNVYLGLELEDSVIPFVDRAIAAISLDVSEDRHQTAGGDPERKPYRLSLPDPSTRQPEKIWKPDHKQYMTLLVYFFVDGCGLTKDEAYLRVGEIGNQLLGWNVNTQESYDRADRLQGSDAIRKRFERLPKWTSEFGLRWKKRNRNDGV